MDPEIIDLDTFTGWNTIPDAVAEPGTLVLEAMSSFRLDASAEEIAFSASLPTVAAPWCRVSGRVILPAAAGGVAVGAAAQVTLTPVPGRVTATVDGELVVVSTAQPVRGFVGSDGRLTDGRGNPYIDVVGCGDGVTPAGEWRYHVVIKGAGATPLVGSAVLRAGTSVNLATVFQA